MHFYFMSCFVINLTVYLTVANAAFMQENLDSTRRLQDGQHRHVTQQLLLPHEIVDSFIREGEIDRMVGSVFWLKYRLDWTCFKFQSETTNRTL